MDLRFGRFDRLSGVPGAQFTLWRVPAFVAAGKIVALIRRAALPVVPCLLLARTLVLAPPSPAEEVAVPQGPVVVAAPLRRGCLHLALRRSPTSAGRCGDIRRVVRIRVDAAIDSWDGGSAVPMHV
ncbi:hypothetical protein E1258_04985 [Micromonospora sp. KC207]|uniref:hypothetical protein n=1 Tax=Micromonospora sp. KC207 TaxID=2530377 RepID=UPI00104D2995|nr:hypothetical protein [Micromonospora sp. KC207]TDC65615.1 hypothetical protein E1258_04985 [Micromonospora sp. KC207]